MVTTLQRLVFTKCHLQCRTLSRLKFPYLQIIPLAQENTYLKVQLSLRIKPRNVQLHNFIEDRSYTHQETRGEKKKKPVGFVFAFLPRELFQPFTLGKVVFIPLWPAACCFCRSPRAGSWGAC